MAVLLLAGCGGGPTPPRSVSGTVELDRSAGRALTVDATTPGGVFTVRGEVRPPDSGVIVLDAVTGRSRPAAVSSTGRFSADVPLRRPVSRYVVVGSRRGHRPWRRTLRILRTSPAGAGRSLGRSTVALPASERTPPQAIIRLERTAAGGPVEVASPAESPVRPVRLASPLLRATGLARDADGGVLRVRITVTAEQRCRNWATGRTTLRRRLWRAPPPAIERLTVAPGTRLRRELVRRVRIDLARGACGGTGPEALEEVAGEVEADATNGRELEAATPIRFVYRTY